MSWDSARSLSARSASPPPRTRRPRPTLPCFELGIGKLDSARWQLTKPLRAPDRFDLVGLRWNRGAHVQAQVRARVAGGRWTRWTALPHPHVPLDGTDPAFTGTADELQLRLRGEARQLTARFVRALDAVPRKPTARASQAAPFVIPRAELGRRPGPAAQRPELRRRAGRVRPSHRRHDRVRARAVAGDRAGHRPLPHPVQRLERHRLQLPRRPLRQRLRGPRGRHRGGRDRRPGAGLQRRLDRHRVPRDVHRAPARRGRRWSRWRGSSAGSCSCTASRSPARSR